MCTAADRREDIFTTKNIDRESKEGKNKGRSDARDDLLIAGTT